MEEGAWPPGQTSAAGQVFEDRVWALLTEQSRGRLHVFRPLLDRGVDALIHRISDGVYIPLQAKGRTSLHHDEVVLDIPAGSVTDDLVVIVAGEIVDSGVGPTMLVVPTPDFRRLARLKTKSGVPKYVMSFGMNPRPISRWLPWLVASDRLVEKFGVAVGLPMLAITEETPQLRHGPLGFLGESEVVRQLAEAEHLNLFRPFPDSETVELAVRHLKNGHVVGLQIKTVSVDAVRPNRPVEIKIASFRSAPTTYFVVPTWVPDERRFHEECLVFPSEELLQFARPDGLHYMFHYRPGSTNQPRLDRYRRRLSDLCTEVESLL